MNQDMEIETYKDGRPPCEYNEIEYEVIEGYAPTERFKDFCEQMNKQEVGVVFNQPVEEDEAQFVTFLYYFGDELWYQDEIISNGALNETGEGLVSIVELIVNGLTTEMEEETQ